MPDLFISYRRGECNDIALLLKKELSSRFENSRVFIDADSIEPGQDFRKTLSVRVADCHVLLAIIGREWLTAADSVGRRRLDKAGDFVRIEIESALVRDIPVVPILVHDAPMPKPEQLPDTLTDLSYRQASKLREPATWDADFAHLAATIEKLVPPDNGRKPQTPGDEATPPDDATDPFSLESAVDVKRCAPLVHDMRRAVLELIAPTYLLDVNYHFLDWNVAFDEIIARPLNLARGQHAASFVEHLDNKQEVIERAKRLFRPGITPLVDTEPLALETEKYGRVSFRKMATQIPDADGETLAWCVHLNILEAADSESLWRDLESSLTQTVNWNRYAESYDELLLNFDEYMDLIKLVTSRVDASQMCADLGAGTGNATIELLRTSPTRQVYAVESNESMLEAMRHKIETSDDLRGDLDGRLFIVKGDAQRLGPFDNDYFDAVTAVNVLYCVPDAAAMLHESHRVLRPGGVLALSMPHKETNVPKLFERMRQRLHEHGKFDELRPRYEDALRRHDELNKLIHRYDRDEIKELIQSTGFEIDEWHDKEYVDSVVVVKAIRH